MIRRGLFSLDSFFKERGESLSVILHVQKSLSTRIAKLLQTITFVKHHRQSKNKQQEQTKRVLKQWDTCE
jgi:hypothetical protein